MAQVIDRDHIRKNGGLTSINQMMIAITTITAAPVPYPVPVTPIGPRETFKVEVFISVTFLSVEQAHQGCSSHPG
ncbi:hypothetical protein ACQR16_18005 [Bradyrhizobium oligotrophicum]|uniref:hypothetical protein n=1 Tax=Bradyrhizobium oligotrophicum TaxID=44255 RepID=UPI003EBEA57A